MARGKPRPSCGRSVLTGTIACIAALGSGWLLFWAAPAGAWRTAEPTIASASVSVEPATSQSLHDQCASGVSASLCEVLTVIHLQVQIPAGGGEDCEGPARVGYASDIGSDGHLTTSWAGGDWESNCYAMEGCPELSACELNWTVDPFAYGGTRDCTNKNFAVEASLEFLGNGEGYSKAYPISIEPPNGCKAPSPEPRPEPHPCPLNNSRTGSGYTGLTARMKQAVTQLYAVIEAAGGCLQFQSGYRSQQRQKELRQQWHHIADHQQHNPHICAKLKKAGFAQCPTGWNSAGIAQGGPALTSRHTSREAADVKADFPAGSGYGPNLSKYRAAVKTVNGLCGPPAGDQVHVYLKYKKGGKLGCWF